MRLPLEVKNLIYNYVFGGNLIHIEFRRFSKKVAISFRHIICPAPISEEEAQRNFDNENLHKWYVPANEDRHTYCYVSLYRPGGSRRFRQGANASFWEQVPSQMLGLSALRCCRQMYNEAHHVPYSANTFSCANPPTLQSFILSLTQGSHNNHLAIRSFFFTMTYEDLVETPAYWRKALNTCVNKCKNLQNVNLSLECVWWDWLWQEGALADFEAKGSYGKTFLLSFLNPLKKLPLKSVTFVFSDARAYPVDIPETGLEDEDGTRWTLKEKQEWARYVKELILN